MSRLRLIPSVILLALILACGVTGSDEPPPPPAPTPPPVAPPPVAPTPAAPVVAPAPPPSGAVEAALFGGQVYVLAHREANAGGAINEYIPMGERLQSWNRMIALRRYGNQSDPAAAAQRVAANMQAQAPPRPHTITPLPDGRTMIEFTTWAGPITEYNLQIFRTDPAGRGLLELQYAERAYGEEPQRFIERMRARGPELIRLLIAYQPPTLLE